MMLEKRKFGYSLIEAVIAVSILAIIISSGLTIILTATGTEQTNKDFLVANMLATEGAQRIKNIYLTNILKFGSEHVLDCGFVHTQKVENVSECRANKIENGIYLLNLPEGITNVNNWELASLADTELILNGNLNPEYRLYTVSVPGNISGTEVIEVYVPFTGTPPETYGPTEYHRQIIISGTEEGSDSISVTSRVGWYRENGEVRTMDINITLPLTL